MGRLTLNVLLSFAQFEREVTSERIWDKIAASKRKGLWVGGPLPFGYDLPSYFLQMSRSAVNLIAHWNAPEKNATEIKRLENTQNECTAIPSPLPAHLVGSKSFLRRSERRPFGE
jgi:DNA invertase Pin-like site-specific DNA recombinase